MTRHGPESSAEFPRLMAGVAAVCAAGAVSAAWPAAEHAIGAGLLAAPLVAGAVWAARRETRIRRRLANTRTTTSTATTSTGSTSTGRGELPRGAGKAGRATETTGAPA